MKNKIIILENDIIPEEQVLSGVVHEIISERVECTILKPESGFRCDLDDSVKGVIVGGGLPSVNDARPWIDEEITFIKQIVSLKLPVFGICFGHQLIGKIFGAEVVRLDKKVGFSKIEKLGEPSIFNGISVSWQSAVYHQDRLEEVPKGFELIATSDYCAVQGMQHSMLPIISVQFHPEIQFGINNVFSEPVPEWNQADSFEKSPNIQIINNFLDICIDR